MTIKHFLFFIVLLLSALILGGVYHSFTTKGSTAEESGELTTEETVAVPGSANEDSFLGENNCRQDSDCSYVWYTGGCYTPEYVAKQQEKVNEMGIHYGEVPPREGVTCTCEENRCVTHN